MNLKNKISIGLLFLFSGISFGQLQTYDKKIKLSTTDEQWNKVKIPSNVFSKVKDDFSDIRIYGITEKDTIEAPYVLKVSTAKGTSSEVDFKLMNTSSNKNGYYFTYEIPTSKTINEIKLDFDTKNFDWKVVLEGSQNQQEWFTLLDDYRILSIQNAQTNYNFTHLNFPDANYRYYRLLVKSDTKPELAKSSLYLDSIVPAQYDSYPVTDFKAHEDNKQTIIDIDIKKRLPLSYLKLNVSDKIDYYRPFRLEYIYDSVQTEKGLRYSYRTISSGILTSMEKNELNFVSTLAQRLRITIQNYDNEPLTFSSAEAKAYAYYIVTRFNKTADYYLVYGNKNAFPPRYDILQTGFKIPENLASLELGSVENIAKTTVPTVAPLFENKWWLWGIMGIVILVLGGFTLNMMQKKT